MKKGREGEEGRERERERRGVQRTGLDGKTAADTEQKQKERKQKEEKGNRKKLC